MDIGWYLRRLSRMDPREVVGRVAHRANQEALRWNASRVIPRSVTEAAPGGVSISIDRSSDLAREVIAAADRLLDGTWAVLGHERNDMIPAPDWFLDPVVGVRAPGMEHAPSINFRDPSLVGGIKRIWEPSRHQHLTVLATAYALTDRVEYAEVVADHLNDWMARNSFMKGIHWTSGIEVGIRLISWTWARRLLAEWSGVADLFEGNPDFVRQIYQHQYFLSVFQSHGSSANNHLFAEASGQLVAACAFPMFPESATWEAEARETLEDEIEIQTFPSGLNRELATEYHGFMIELALVAACEASLCGRAMSERYWATFRRKFDALASIVDVTLRPPRQGDADDGRGILLDSPLNDHAVSLLSLGRALFGAPAWWPDVPLASSVTAAVIPEVVRPPVISQPRMNRRRDVLADAGMVLLRTEAERKPEIWVRFDVGPHGFLSIAPHAHADALSIEVRYDGVDVLADPGTYVYHSDPEWRAYFQSTKAHNTLRIDGKEQSEPGGPFMWTTHARSIFTVSEQSVDGVVACRGSHDGYQRLPEPATHQRRVLLDREAMLLRIDDQIMGDGLHDIDLVFHLGPLVEIDLNESAAHLDWGTGSGRLSLPKELTWSAVRGQENPPAGWYSASFGVRTPSWMLVGEGDLTSSGHLLTELAINDREVSKDR